MVEEIIEALQSEHCSYKSTRELLRALPGTRTSENAGVILLDENWSLVFKIESHNHPSAVEPYQGAATGVGGILRDVFAMGARPIALMNSLHFAEGDARLDHVISGLADYGNCVGISNVGGELRLSPAYAHNPLVNVMAVGIARRERILSARAPRSGLIVMLYGGATGRDGLGGAAFASRRLGEKTACVQVGDPFMEKKILEATLELGMLAEAVTDLGAGGLAVAAIESAARGGVGIDLQLERVLLREAEMTPEEILLSESQERMLAFVAPENTGKVEAILTRWEVPYAAIGTTITKETFMGIPISNVLNIPTPGFARRPQREQEAIRHLPWPFLERFDHMIGCDVDFQTAGKPAVILRTPAGKIAITITSEGVERAAANLREVGATPLAITNGINCGDPNDVYGEVEESILKLGADARAVELPVVSGNVSLYNQTGGRAIPPTVVIGMVGVMR